MTWCSPWISGNVNKYSYIQRWVISWYHDGCKSSLGRLEMAFLLVLLKPQGAVSLRLAARSWDVNVSPIRVKDNS